jgi:hypothetical protein
MATAAMEPKKDGKTGWSIAQFEAYRPDLTEFIKQKIQPHIDSGECKRLLIRAPVKSGKREQVEYIAMRDFSKNPQRVHAFISAFHRTADNDQRAELKLHNLNVFSIITKTKADEFLDWFALQIAAGKHVVVHLDESDFASGNQQTLCPVYKAIRDEANTTAILYTATHPEMLFSGDVGNPDQELVNEIHEGGVCVEYEPPANFCGPARFLDEGLVSNATRFFIRISDGRLALTPQGLEIIRGLRDSIAVGGTERNIIVLRLPTGETKKKEGKDIYQFLQYWQSIPELAGFLVFADKDIKAVPNSDNVNKSPIQWSNKMFWKGITKDIPIIVVIDQTSSRSTEWACHDRIYALHDFRKQITFTTVSQADERVNHYVGHKYPSFQPIKVYGHKKSFELSAKRIDYQTYLNNDWEAKQLSQKELDAKKLEGSHFLIRKPTTREPHPAYPVPVPITEKDRILELLCCHADVKLSARVIGGEREVSIFEAEFYSCSNETFNDVNVLLRAKIPNHRFNNPFPASLQKGLVDGQYKGFLRGCRVFDYDRDIKTEAGWGISGKGGSSRITICYKDGVLGLGLRYDTGRKEIRSTLEAFRSMYQNPRE